MAPCLGYGHWQQREVRSGLPERSYWHKDKLKMEANVAAEIGEHDCVIRKPHFLTGLPGEDQPFQRQSLAQSRQGSKQTAGRPRQTSYVL